MAQNEGAAVAGMNEAAAGVNASVKKSKHRSPNYPAIGLEKSIERAQEVKEQAGRNAMPVTVAHTTWGYKTGAGNQIVAALRAFGLVEVTGEGDKRQLRLTDAGWRITGNAPDRDNLLKEAALKPTIHAEIWKNYNGDLPKLDAIIREWLVWEKGFNQDFVDGFIAQFRATIAYAKLSSSDKVAQQNDGIETPANEGKPKMQNPATFTPPKIDPPLPPPSGKRAYPLYLSPETEGVLTVPTIMTQTQYDLLKSQIESSLKVMAATAVIPDPQPYPVSAMWKNADHDQPVIVIGELGPGPDGKRYFKVQGSASGIPEDQLEFDVAEAKGSV